MNKALSRTASAAVIGLSLSCSAAFALSPEQEALESQNQDSVFQMLPESAKQTMFFDYAQYGMTEAALMMIDKGYIDVNVQDARGHTALMLAAIHGQTNVALGLMSRGADRALKDNYRQLTAAEWAKARGHHTTALFIDNFVMPGPASPKMP